MENRTSQSTLSLEQLRAFNDELVALHRARLPLPQGLRLAANLPGRVGQKSATLLERLTSGEPLEKILADTSLGLGGFYQRLLLLGVRSGDLGWALTLAQTVFSWRQTARASLGLAGLYSVVVYTVGAAGLCVMIWTVIPEMIRQFEDLGSLDNFFYGLVVAAHTCRVAIAIGLALFGLLGIGVYFGWGPDTRGSRRTRWERVILQAEVLARLVRAGVGVDESIDLTSRAFWRNGNAGLQDPTDQLELPVALNVRQHRSDLPVRLEATSRVFRDKMESLQGVQVAPMFASPAVGACLALAYTLLIFAPWCKILVDMAEAISCHVINMNLLTRWRRLITGRWSLPTKQRCESHWQSSG